MNDEITLGQALDFLFADLDAKKDADPTKSYTASLLQKGPAKCAKKLGEEAVELALEIAAGEKEEIKAEAADVLYHFVVALMSRGVSLNEVAQVLAKRRGIGGLDEKASRKK
ncbi:phosphoribosyl-ATP diphosphatase [Pseudaquidulcibacter saccharophilus]|uniref:phosphoribosyl-ATP diphosphatase n=1 Tax=Pseudaquidulcibacter saccharophilus TaxID=2831900 RepID=UPI001EFF2ABA|nr:phosphoribosyl-ATP diphosphatase [Pseudaquidulcibacter saccharophilus]